MERVFELLRENNFISRKGVRLSAIESIPKNKIIDIAQAIVTETKLPVDKRDATLFSHSASLSLGGSREECEKLACRTQKINELVRFALFYSDKVYINNFFSGYIHLKDLKDESKIKARFYDDVCLMQILKPFFESKHILLFTSPEHRCPNCWANLSFGPDASNRLKKEYRRLAREYFENTSVKLFQRNGAYGVLFEGPEPYYEHGRGVISPTPPPALNSMPRVLQRAKSIEGVTLSKATSKKLEFHKAFATEVLNNISFELSASHFLNTSFLTEKMLHVSFLQSISNNPDIERRNAIAYKFLTSIVPFAEDVEIKDLIKLRRREEEAFIQYRRALNEAIDEFKTSDVAFNERQARTLYSDVIAPQLSMLDQKVQVAKKDLVTKAYRSILAVTGAISFGIYTGFIPTEMAEMAKVLGFTKVGADILEKLLPLGDAASAVKNDEMYFLWRARKLQK
ncbi:MAG TPA: hypothetical protein VF131_21215 [Blastocatellia bacterium]|nr:hypothetical protein [Blastocatellia bacterium]